MNNMVDASEKIGGSLHPQWMYDGFKDALLQCKLENLMFVGEQFTWERSQGTDRWIQE